MTRARNDRGFTLVELLIAFAIVGALLAIAFGGLRVATAAWQKGEDRAEAHQHARGVAFTLARSLGTAYPYLAPRTTNSEPELLFRGQAHRIEMVSQTPPFAFPIPVAFAAVVIELGEGNTAGLVVKQRALPNREPFTEAATVLNDPTVTDLTFSYMDDGGSWSDTWDATTSNTLPRAIKVTVGAKLDGRAETMPLTVSLKVIAP
jgi:prepilin-type N-terminal cleavage/methylation domain-containing protein